MRSGSRTPVIVLFLFLAAFAAGVSHLFLLRFSGGDVFPPYSSLRSDPLGVKVLYESLGRLPGITVLRNFRLRGGLPSGRDVAVFYLGARASILGRMPEGEAKRLEESAASGGRLVVAFFPEGGGAAPPPEGVSDPDEDETTPPTAPPGSAVRKRGRKEGDGRRDTRNRSHFVDMGKRWGFRFTRAPLPASRENAVARTVIPDGTPSGVPLEIPWRSAFVFDNIDDAWRVVCERDGRPVLIERAWGNGTILLSSDTYFLSNEAMRRHRRSALLARLAGECRTIMFDESHLGVAEDRTVVSLARKYRLHGLLAGVLLLSALYVWMKSTPFLPPRQGGLAQDPEDPAAGRDSRAAFANLLRRNIPPEALLEVCFEEWSRSLSHHRTTPGNKLDRARDVVETERGHSPRERDPLKGYRTITRILRGELVER